MMPFAKASVTRTAKGIARVLWAQGLLDEGVPVRIERTRAGHWQRSEGSWSWWAATENGAEIAGSQWPAGTILKSKNVISYLPAFGNWELEPGD